MTKRNVESNKRRCREYNSAAGPDGREADKSDRWKNGWAGEGVRDGIGKKLQGPQEGAVRKSWGERSR